MANEKYTMMAENPTGTGSLSLNRRAGSTIGANSHTEGSDNIASGNSAHAEGANTTASGSYSHAEGSEAKALGYISHAEGNGTIASGSYSHAEGGSYKQATITADMTEAQVRAAWEADRSTIAHGQFSHAEGSNTLALATWSHAEGSQAIASGSNSHAEGSSTESSGADSHAEGRGAIASNYASHASGKYNAAMTTGGSINNTTGTAFVVGNGTSTTARSNALSVQFNGVVKAKSTITASTTADYAEFFEWLDGNPDDEDRVGYFVTLEGDKIKIATSSEDYILGVVSGEPFVLGNGDCDTWTNMHLRDEFRRTIYEPAPKLVPILDEEGLPTGEYEEVAGEYEGTRPQLNPEYDPTQEYISRFDRSEWAPVGMLGVLAVRHDGTAQVDGYVTVNSGGIATACVASTENCYRVIKSNSDSVVEIMFNSSSKRPDNLVYLDSDDTSSAVAEPNVTKQELQDIVSDAYSSELTYAVGDFCIHDNKLYKCTTAVETAEDFDLIKWELTSIDGEIGALKNEITTLSTSLEPQSVTITSDNLHSSAYAHRVGKLLTAHLYFKDLELTANTAASIGTIGIPPISVSAFPCVFINVNNTELLGYGNIVIGSGGAISVRSNVNMTSARCACNLSYVIAE